MADDMWGTIHREREALAGDLGGLTPQQWDTRSWCTGWSVRDVLAHLTSTAQMTPAKFVGGFASTGFRFPVFAQRGVERFRGADGAGALAAFVAHQHDSSSPPGPKTSWLGETLVHAQDIRGPLGIEHDYPVDALRQVADFYQGSNALIGTKSRIAGLRLVATDADWAHGSGPEVRGPMLSLVMAMTGRRPALADLEGEGVATLQQR